MFRIGPDETTGHSGLLTFLLPAGPLLGQVRIPEPPVGMEYSVGKRPTQFILPAVHVLIDSYFDRRTVVHFGVNPVGAKVDLYRFDDTQEDPTWDAVWDVATRIDEKGWTAEFRIPLSQLRFGNQEDQTWGIDFAREIARRNEASSWAPIRQSEAAMVSKFGELQGLKGLGPSTRMELRPFSLARLDRAPGEEEDPFYHPNDFLSSAGVDLKYGVTNDLTLDVTINPDFRRGRRGHGLGDSLLLQTHRAAPPGLRR